MLKSNFIIVSKRKMAEWVISFSDSRYFYLYNLEKTVTLSVREKLKIAEL
jgi:hypothetical protein